MYSARPSATGARGVGRSVKHHDIDIDGITIFYREAGPEGAPVLLLPHGYPCSIR
jgi:hypothetical protein